MDAKTHPMIVYVHRDRRYVELCDTSEEAAVYAPAVDCDGDATAIMITNDDVIHSHRADGACIPLTAHYRTPRWYAMRVAVGRAYIAGFDWVRI